ncbi:HEXXH motif-containing protein [Nocardia tenerifensis]|uniref:HEXXH motif-containing protein n=1 Tax=Nocardia tenerifensis TaxID=228006 RepID=A0A318JU74_9NOCA|nr:HEXXH motif-containing putative peptide modification protein [Nocardia tenerifensis]PXX58771.1 HEXXH motif-containing protein [Nocardia tenerifensis]
MSDQTALTTTLDARSLDRLALTTVQDFAYLRYTERLRGSVPRVVRRIGALGGADIAFMLDAWCDVFLALPEAAARRVVSHPFFNYYWLQLSDACLRRDHGFLSEWAHHLPRFLVIPALEQGLPIPTPVLVPAGRPELRLPGSSAHLVFHTRAQGLRVFFDDDGDGVLRGDTVRIPGHYPKDESAGPLGSVTRVAHPTIPDTGIEIDAGDPWLARLIASMNGKPAQPGYPAPDLALMTEPGATKIRQIGESFELIERVWPELAAEMTTHVRLFVPYRSAFHSSFTEACMMGAVFLSEAMWPFSDIAYTAEHFLHEEAHLRLTLIEELDPLLSPAEDVTYDSPWRADPRPLSGLIQACFAFGRIAAFHRRAREVTGESVHDKRLAETVDLLARGMAEVESGPRIEFTEVGDQLWSQLREEASAR